MADSVIFIVARRTRPEPIVLNFDKVRPQAFLFLVLQVTGLGGTLLAAQQGLCLSTVLANVFTAILNLPCCIAID